jgi:hypothetical protein
MKWSEIIAIGLLGALAAFVLFTLLFWRVMP